MQSGLVTIVTVYDTFHLVGKLGHALHQALAIPRHKGRLWQSKASSAGYACF